MIIHLAQPGRYIRLLYIILIGLLTFDLVCYPAVANAQRRRDNRQNEEQTERRPEASTPFSSQSLEETITDATQQTSVSSIGKAAYEAVILSGKYIIGSGDFFTVVYTVDGEIQTDQIPVSASGHLVIPTIGPILVAGLPLKKARQAIREAVDKRYRNLDITITLSQLRTFPVDIIGDVRVPGDYGVKGAEQVSQLIIQAGGLIETPERRGSLRNIEIRTLQDGQWKKTERRADLLLWNLTGNAKYNPFLIDGEQVFVPLRGDSINVSGAVLRPDNYEFAPGDRVSDLLLLGGGLRNQAVSQTALLRRLTEPDPIHIDIQKMLANDPESNILLQAGDKLYVTGEVQWVYVEGEVQFPGPYPIKEELRLRELLERAIRKPEGSLAQASVIRKVDFEKKDEDEEDIVLERLLDIQRDLRTDAEEALISLKTQQLTGRLPIDFNRLMAGDESQNILLRDGDVIRLPRFVPSVRVYGAVGAPANIPYDPKSSVMDYIIKAGGFTTRARREGIQIVQGSTENPIANTPNLVIHPGDAIYVPDSQPTPGQGYRIFRETLAMAGAIASLILTIQAINR